MSYEFYGTIKPKSDFNAESAADMLYEAMKGSGCDKYRVIQVIAHCNNAQRQMVLFVFFLFCQFFFFKLFFFSKNFQLIIDLKMEYFCEIC